MSQLGDVAWEILYVAQDGLDPLNVTLLVPAGFHAPLQIELFGALDVPPRVFRMDMQRMRTWTHWKMPDTVVPQFPEEAPGEAISDEPTPKDLADTAWRLFQHLDRLARPSRSEPNPNPPVDLTTLVGTMSTAPQGARTELSVEHGMRQFDESGEQIFPREHKSYWFGRGDVCVCAIDEDHIRLWNRVTETEIDGEPVVFPDIDDHHWPQGHPNHKHYLVDGGWYCRQPLCRFGKDASDGREKH